MIPTELRNKHCAHVTCAVDATGRTRLPFDSRAAEPRALLTRPVSFSRADRPNDSWSPRSIFVRSPTSDGFCVPYVVAFAVAKSNLRWRNTKN